MRVLELLGWTFSKKCLSMHLFRHLEFNSIAIGIQSLSYPHHRNRLGTQGLSKSMARDMRQLGDLLPFTSRVTFVHRKVDLTITVKGD